MVYTASHGCPIYPFSEDITQVRWRVLKYSSAFVPCPTKYAEHQKRQRVNLVVFGSFFLSLWERRHPDISSPAQGAESQLRWMVFSWYLCVKRMQKLDSATHLLHVIKTNSWRSSFPLFTLSDISVLDSSHKPQIVLWFYDSIFFSSYAVWSSETDKTVNNLSIVRILWHVYLGNRYLPVFSEVTHS